MAILGHITIGFSMILPIFITGYSEAVKAPSFYEDYLGFIPSSISISKVHKAYPEYLRLHPL